MSGTQYQVIQTNFLLSQIVPTHTTPKKKSSKETLKNFFQTRKKKDWGTLFSDREQVVGLHMKIF